MDHRIGEGRAYWERQARTDPMWAVLSDPAKKGRKWNLREFMANGEREIALLWHQLARLDLTPTPGTALDFGCGIGRLTQALARRFDRVIGVDISPTMIAVARDINHYPAIAEYVCNGHPDLRDVPSRSVDFIYSNIVLQHIEPQLSIEYLNEFFRLLKPGGVLVFQLPSHQEPAAEVAIRPMPDEAYQARVELTAPLVARGVESETLVAVRITNTSPHEWRQREYGSIQVGNRWFDATGRYMVIQDDGRAALPQIMKPGESCDVVLRIIAPSTAGSYQGEIDVVHEGVTWFRDKGSRMLRFDREVSVQVPATATTSTATINELPVPEYREVLETIDDADEESVGFPMHGVPLDEVRGLVNQHGGSLIHLEDGLRAGVEWVDYRYFVRAPQSPAAC